MADREQFLREFHARYPGITSRVLARTGSYERLAARIDPGARTLDLGCGDGHLVGVLVNRGCNCIGLDVSAAELALAQLRGAVVRARAQALPFADRAFDAVVSHLVFMLLEDVERTVAELARVLVPGGRFVAVLGGGPVADDADGDDAFHAFLAIARPYLRGAMRFGDPRARTEAGWRALFAGWRTITFERDELDLSGELGDVWPFFASSYELAAIGEHEREAIRSRLAEHTGKHGRLMCRAVIWIATAVR